MASTVVLRELDEYPWYAIRTKARLEPQILRSLEGKGYTTYSPTYKRRKKWSDRTVEVDTPLFPGYVFARFDVKRRLPILQTPGVLSIVSFGREPEAVDEQEIEAVRTALAAGAAAEPFPFLREGQKVRIVRGSMTGLEGILVRKKAEYRLLISVTMLQRSVAVEIEDSWIETVK